MSGNRSSWVYQAVNIRRRRLDRFTFSLGFLLLSLSEYRDSDVEGALEGAFEGAFDGALEGAALVRLEKIDSALVSTLVGAWL